MFLWSGDDLGLLPSLLEELKAAGIPYFNRAIGNYSLRAFPNHFPVAGAPPFGFEVSVLASDFERARAILETIENAS